MAKINWRDTDDLEAYEEHFQKTIRDRKKGKKEKRIKKDKESQFILDREKWAESLKQDHFAARVVEVHKRYAFVSPEQGNDKEIDTKDVWLATVSRKHLTAAKDERNFICVGDVVLCRPADEKDGVVESELPQCVIQNMSPRKTRIARIDPHRKDLQHVLASNLDQLAIVASYAKPTVKWGLIDRYLVLAHCEDIEPIIVLNKMDLLEELPEKTRLDYEFKRDYLRKIGYKVIEIQANESAEDQDATIEQLGEILSGKVTLFSGHSGVGKSSLVNLFEPEIEQEVEPDEDIFYKGRHTTTYASLIKLSGLESAYIVDTPGIRSFCIKELDSIALTDCFPDLRPLAEKCQYRECRHVEEPVCGVRDAVENGDLPEYRYKSYLAVLLGASGREGRMREIEVEE